MSASVLELLAHIPIFWVMFTGMTIMFLVIWIGYRAASYGDVAVLIVYLEIMLLAFTLAMYFYLGSRVSKLTGFPPF